ncbi:hypothetical protein B296_00036899, partial [Ensete ventricosum]
MRTDRYRVVPSESESPIAGMRLDEAMTPSLRRNEALPHLPARDEAPPLLLVWENEAPPCSTAASFSRDVRRC